MFVESACRIAAIWPYAVAVLSREMLLQLVPPVAVKCSILANKQALDSQLLLRHPEISTPERRTNDILC
jgi:hypothetical protein